MIHRSLWWSNTKVREHQARPKRVNTKARELDDRCLSSVRTNPAMLPTGILYVVLEFLPNRDIFKLCNVLKLSLNYFLSKRFSITDVESVQRFMATGTYSSLDGSKIEAENVDDVKLWFKHLTKGYQVTLTTDYGIYSVAVDDDCRIVCGGLGGGLSIWNMDGHQQILKQENTDTINCVAISGDRVVTSTYRRMKLWSIDGQCLNTFIHADSVSGVNCVSFLGADRLVCGNTGILCVWNFEGILLKTINAHDIAITSVTTCGEQIVSGSSDRTAKLWNYSNGQMQQIFVHDDIVTSVALLDVKKIVSGSLKRIRIWNFSGECVMTLRSGHVTSIAVLDNDRIVSASIGDTVSVWNIASGECLHRLEGHSKMVRSVTTHRGRIISSSYDRTIKIWTLPSGQG